MEKSKLILDYIKALIYPILIAVLFCVYHKELSNFFGNLSKIKLGDIELSKEIQQESMQNNQQMKAELDSILAVINQDTASSSSDQQKREEMISRIQSVHKSINVSQKILAQKVEAISSGDENKYVEIKNKEEEAANREKEAFDYLLEEDWQKAAESFSNAEQSLKGYHNCYELSRLLKSFSLAEKRENKSELRILYDKILSDYTWGMPTEVKSKLQDKREALTEKTNALNYQEEWLKPGYYNPYSGFRIFLSELANNGEAVFQLCDAGGISLEKMRLSEGKTAQFKNLDYGRISIQYIRIGRAGKNPINKAVYYNLTVVK